MAFDRLKWQREYRRANGNASSKKYEKTKKGFLVRLYSNMRNRVEGKIQKAFHLYAGLDILSRQEFYRWAFDNPDFHELFKEWEESGYERRLTPSVDRIDAREGYILINMEFVPFHENCRNIRRF